MPTAKHRHPRTLPHLGEVSLVSLAELEDREHEGEADAADDNTHDGDHQWLDHAGHRFD